MPFSCAYDFIVMGHIKLPISVLEVLIIKKLHLKVSKKTIQKMLLKIISRIINIKFIFIINTFALSIIKL
jgi:hypothetical protein